MRVAKRSKDAERQRFNVILDHSFCLSMITQGSRKKPISGKPRFRDLGTGARLEETDARVNPLVLALDTP